MTTRRRGRLSITRRELDLLLLLWVLLLLFVVVFVLPVAAEWLRP